MTFQASVAFAPSRAQRALAVAVALACLVAFAAAPAVRPVRAAAPAPLKAVFIVGPTDGLTNSNLADAEALAKEAELWGMDVRRVFFPNATWENVLAHIQGANLVVYMGHGYGWPSPYTAKMTESRQNGMGLNSFVGSGPSQYTYYGATKLKESVVLAPNALVFLNHLCYSAGNGEAGMDIPTWDVARQRVDNMANGWLASGAKAVFAYGSQSYIRTIRALMSTDSTIEDIFKIPGAEPRYYHGWIGWDPRKFDSVRTPGATNFMDPDPKSGFYRAVTGDLGMTARQWAEGPDGPSGPAPRMSDVSGSATDGVSVMSGGNMPVFTPNGDGVTDSLKVTYNLDREAFVDWVVRSSSGDVVRSFTSWSRSGSASVSWNGKGDDGAWVSDGTFTVSGTPRNRAGTEGNSVSLDVKVLTTMRSPAVSPGLFHAADGDNLAPRTTMTVSFDKPASFTWKVVDDNDELVRSNLNNVNVGAGQQSWQWDGRNDAGAFVANGVYYSVMTAATSAGTYSHKVPVEVRAFRLVRSTNGAIQRGVKLKYLVYSAEPLSASYPKPKVRVTAPGLALKIWGTYKQSDGGFYANITVPTTAGNGTVHFRVQGTDANGVIQYTDYYFPLQ